MRHGFVKLAGVPAMAVLLQWTGTPVAAQSPKAPTKAHGPRRMADGHPDLQGTYDLATLTPLERPFNAKPAYTAEEARKMETAAALQRERGDQAIKGDRTAPPKG